MAQQHQTFISVNFWIMYQDTTMLSRVTAARRNAHARVEAMTVRDVTSRRAGCCGGGQSVRDHNAYHFASRLLS